MRIECERCGKTIEDSFCINLGGDGEQVCYHRSCIEEQLKQMPDRYLAALIMDRLDEDMVPTPEVKEEHIDWEGLELDWARDLQEFLQEA